MGIGVASDDLRQIAPNITPVPPPSVKELVETHQSRFQLITVDKCLALKTKCSG
jgi:hypothetical protein